MRPFGEAAFEGGCVTVDGVSNGGSESVGDRSDSSAAGLGCRTYGLRSYSSSASESSWYLYAPTADGIWTSDDVVG